VQPGKSLLTLASAGETRITAQIDEKNLPYLKVGAAAVASADAFPDAKFNAALYYIAPGVDAQRGAVEARFNVPEPPAHLRADMTLSIEITGSRKEQALVVPLEAVRSAGNGGSAVLVANSDHATSRPVKLGLHGDGKVEVAEGLQAGEQVILNAAIVPGTRVRVHVVDPARVAERAS
jgi:HlyD family secretion protein